MRILGVETSPLDLGPCTDSDTDCSDLVSESERASVSCRNLAFCTVYTITRCLAVRTIHCELNACTGIMKVDITSHHITVIFHRATARKHLRELGIILSSL
jgi:hypothetical protein